MPVCGFLYGVLVSSRSSNGSDKLARLSMTACGYLEYLSQVHPASIFTQMKHSEWRNQMKTLTTLVTVLPKPKFFYILLSFLMILFIFFHSTEKHYIPTTVLEQEDVALGVECFPFLSPNESQQLSFHLI